MKTKLLILISCIGIFTASGAYSYCASCSASDDNDSGYSSCFGSSCTCTDPACSRGASSSCISRSECCEAFGNIAGGQFTPLDDGDDDNVYISDNSYSFNNYTTENRHFTPRARSYKGE